MNYCTELMSWRRKNPVSLLKTACRKACPATRAHLYLVFVLGSFFPVRLDNFVKGKEVRSNTMAISS